MTLNQDAKSALALGGGWRREVLTIGHHRDKSIVGDADWHLMPCPTGWCRGETRDNEGDSRNNAGEKNYPQRPVVRMVAAHLRALAPVAPVATGRRIRV